VAKSDQSFFVQRPPGMDRGVMVNRHSSNHSKSFAALDVDGRRAKTSIRRLEKPVRDNVCPAA